MKPKIEDILLIVLLIVSLTIIFLVKFAWAQVPEIWNFGYEIGEIAYDLSLASIGSLIFYWIVVVIPQKRTRSNILVHAGRLTDHITYLGNNVLDGLANKIEWENKDKEISHEDFMVMCSKIGPTSWKDYFATKDDQFPVTYFDQMRSMRNEVKQTAERLFVYMPHLDSEHIRLVNEILFCQFIASLDGYFLKDAPYSGEKHTTFELISSPLYEFYRKARDLRKYRGKNSMWSGVFVKNTN